MHAKAQTHTDACTHARTRAHTRTHTHNTHTHAHTRTQAHAHSCTQIRAHARTQCTLSERRSHDIHNPMFGHKQQGWQDDAHHSHLCGMEPGPTLKEQEHLVSISATPAELEDIGLGTGMQRCARRATHWNRATLWIRGLRSSMCVPGAIRIQWDKPCEDRWTYLGVEIVHICQAHAQKLLLEAGHLCRNIRGCHADLHLETQGGQPPPCTSKKVATLCASKE